MHRQLCISPTNVKLLTNANEEAPCPSSPTKQGQVSCADFGQPFFTNSLHSSPTETTAHSCQPTAQIHSPTPSLHSYVPFAIHKLHWRAGNGPKLTRIHTLINWTVPCFDRVGTLSGCGGWHSTSAQTGKGSAQLIHSSKSLACNRALLLGESKLWQRI